MKVSMDVLGIDDLQRKLTELGTRTANGVFRRALNASGKRIADAVISRATIDTGRLVEGINMAPLRARRGRVGVLIRTGSRADLGISATDPYYYPAAVEYGHATPGGKRVPPHPFVRPAFDARVDSETQRITNEIFNELQRAFVVKGTFQGTTESLTGGSTPASGEAPGD